MSNLIINWRFWIWHFQVVHWCDWRHFRAHGYPIATWTRNEWQLQRGRGGLEDLPPLWRRPVALYEGARYLLVPIVLLNLALWWVL